MADGSVSTFGASRVGAAILGDGWMPASSSAGWEGHLCEPARAQNRDHRLTFTEESGGRGGIQRRFGQYRKTQTQLRQVSLGKEGSSPSLPACSL